MDIYSDAPFPHCDSSVLHAPGNCEYCDHYPLLQQVRANLAIPFSGEGGSPDEKLRPREIIDAWPGNQPKRKGRYLALYSPDKDKYLQAHVNPKGVRGWGPVDGAWLFTDVTSAFKCLEGISIIFDPCPELKRVDR